MMDVLFGFHLLYVCTDQWAGGYDEHDPRHFEIMFNVRLTTCSLVLSLIVVAANYDSFTCNLHILFLNDANILCCRRTMFACLISCTFLANKQYFSLIQINE
jgi:hypothetical protein